jgi:hypothetical protein
MGKAILLAVASTLVIYAAVHHPALADWRFTPPPATGSLDAEIERMCEVIARCSFHSDDPELVSPCIDGANEELDELDAEHRSVAAGLFALATERCADQCDRVVECYEDVMQEYE